MAKKGAADDDEKKRKAQAHRDAMAEASRESHDAVAEIGELPEVVNPERKERARLNLEYYLAGSGYFPASTGKSPFSAAHKRVISRFQSSILNGELDWTIVFRGFAKTTLSVGSVLWGASYGHIHFCPMFGATKELGCNLVDLLKAEWETNDELYADFPEICHPIRALEGKPQRCQSQTYRGELTGIQWKGNRIVLPTMPGSPASGFCAIGMGLLQSTRGLVIAMPDGTRQRPDWFVIDDPQTDASAASGPQILKRLTTIRKAILKLGGHQSTIGGVIAGTIIEPDDVMDQLRDRQKFPQFQGEVVKMVEQWADAHESFWLDDYRKVLTSYDSESPGEFERAKAAATELYRSRQKEADAGCIVAWEHCYDHDWEISAIQHAYNSLILDGEDVFGAEAQSEPIRPTVDSPHLTINDVIYKLSGLKRYEVPANATKLTAFIDVQHESLWYVVVAWTEDFTGYVIDYGVWPEQTTRVGLSKSKLRKTLSKKYADQKDAAVRIRMGLTDLADAIIGRDWLDSDGRTHRIAVCFVDQQEGKFSKQIRAWARASKFSTVLRPFSGQGIGPAAEPMPQRKKRNGEVRRGLYWIEEKDPATKGGTITSVDKNWWSTFAAARWRSGSPRPANDDSLRPCERGALYVWGTDPRDHDTFGNHQCSEYATPLTHNASGRQVDVWALKPGKPDNELWDGVVGNCAAADYAGGIQLKDSGLTSTTTKKRKRRTREELAKLKEARRNGR